MATQCVEEERRGEGATERNFTRHGSPCGHELFVNTAVPAAVKMSRYCDHHNTQLSLEVPV
jgi:hypothetical protein